MVGTSGPSNRVNNVVGIICRFGGLGTTLSVTNITVKGANRYEHYTFRYYTLLLLAFAFFSAPAIPARPILLILASRIAFRLKCPLLARFVNTIIEGRYEHYRYEHYKTTFETEFLTARLAFQKK